LILAVLVLSLLIVVLDNSVLNVALKIIADPAEGLGATQTQLQWAINSYTLVFAGMLFTWGVLGDRRGRKRVLLIGFVLFGLASLACAYAQTPEQLIAARAFMGLGGAAVMPSTLAIIANVFDPRERGKAIGIWSGAVGMAIAIGPIVGGFLLDHFWWGSVFLINVPIVVAGFILIAVLVPESKNPQPGKLDPVGVLLQLGGLVLVVYGIIRIGDLGKVLDATVIVPLVVGIAVLAGFVRWELNSDHPALDVRLFAKPRFSASVAAIGLVFFALMGVVFFMSFFLQSVRGYSPFESGLLILPLAIGQVLTSPRSPGLAHRYGPRVVTTAGMLIVTGTMLGYLLLGVDSPIWVLGVLFFFQGIGMGNVMPPATESVMASVPRERAGAASAVNNTVRQVGVALGVAVLGTILSTAYRHRMAPVLDPLPLPQSVKDAMGQSIAATNAVIEKGGAAAQSLVDPANEAFVHAMHITVLCSAAVAFLGALITWIFLPPKDEIATVPALDAPAAEVAAESTVA
jgi:EmrB/QacA subfamily drug resistance transporter